MTTAASLPGTSPSTADPAPMAPATVPFIRLALIGTAATATILAGIAMISADEHTGTAHLPMSHLLAQRPELAAQLGRAPQPASTDDADISFDKPASAINRMDTDDTIANRAPGEAATVPVAPAPSNAWADRQFIIKRILPITEPIRYGAWHWDEAGVPPGPIVITVDLQARVLSIFRGGYEIGTAAVLLGTQETPTPLGVFPITQKDEHHISNLYDAAMPFMMRLTNDGISIHATNVRNGYASHGCIGVPIDFARKLFATTHLHDKVIITRGKRAGLGEALEG